METFSSSKDDACEIHYRDSIFFYISRLSQFFCEDCLPSSLTTHPQKQLTIKNDFNALWTFSHRSAITESIKKSSIASSCACWLKGGRILTKSECRRSTHNLFCWLHAGGIRYSSHINRHPVLQRCSNGFGSSPDNGYRIHWCRAFGANARLKPNVIHSLRTQVY